MMLVIQLALSVSRPVSRRTHKANAILEHIGRSCTELAKFECHMYMIKHKQNIP
jgi:hypothetical protein